MPGKRKWPLYRQKYIIYKQSLRIIFTKKKIKKNKMENKNWNSLTQKIFSGSLLIALLFLFNSCSKKIAFQSSSVVPAAEGTVKVTKDNNSNYVIRLELSNLAEPEKLQPSKQTYVCLLYTSNYIIHTFAGKKAWFFKKKSNLYNCKK